MEYLIHKPVSDSKDEDVVNEGTDPGDDTLGDVAVDTSDTSVIKFDTNEL